MRRRLTRREWSKTALAGMAASAIGSQRVSATQTPAGKRSYRYLHLDVFTDRLLTGNQLAVFLDPAGLDTDTMQSIAREMSFSESTFVFPAEDGKSDRRVRIFTENAELPFAGHPTIGTTFALAEAGQIKAGSPRVVLGLGVGPITVDLEWKTGKLSFAWMTQLAPTFGKTVDDLNALASCLGVEPGAIRGVGKPPQEVSCGSMFLFVPMTTRQAVDAVVVDRRALENLYKQAGMERRGVFVFSTEAAQDGATAYSRMVGTGASEDPATGSATGPLGCYLVHHGLVTPAQAERMISVQGVKMKRPSRLYINITMASGQISRVRVGGESQIVGDGTVRI